MAHCESGQNSENLQNLFLLSEVQQERLKRRGRYQQTKPTSQCLSLTDFSLRCIPSLNSKIASRVSSEAEFRTDVIGHVVAVGVLPSLEEICVNYQDSPRLVMNHFGHFGTSFDQLRRGG